MVELEGDEARDGSGGVSQGLVKQECELHVKNDRLPPRNFSIFKR